VFIFVFFFTSPHRAVIFYVLMANAWPQKHIGASQTISCGSTTHTCGPFCVDQLGDRNHGDWSNPRGARAAPLAPVIYAQPSHSRSRAALRTQWSCSSHRSHCSDIDPFSTPQLFHTNFYNHAHRLRLEKPLCIELSRSPNAFFYDKPLLASGSR
jgi:hypothetical protein